MENNKQVIAFLAIILLSGAAIAAYLLSQKQNQTAGAIPQNNNSQGLFGGLFGGSQNQGYDNGYFDNWDFLTDGTSGTTNEGNTASYYDSSIPDSDGSNDYTSGPSIFDAIGGFIGGIFSGGDPSTKPDSDGSNDYNSKV